MNSYSRKDGLNKNGKIIIEIGSLIINDSEAIRSVLSDVIKQVGTKVKNKNKISY